MDLSFDDSFINNALDDSFLLIKSEEDEVVNILKKWNVESTTSSPHHKVEVESNSPSSTTTFNSKTFTRPPKKLLFSSQQISHETDVAVQESKNNTINLQVGGEISHSMKKSWLGDVSPPNSMDSFSHGSIMQSLITSSDFSNISGFLLNEELDLDKTITTTATRKVPVRNSTFRLSNHNHNHDRSKSNATFSIDVESPMKEFGVENVDIELDQSTEDLDKDITFNVKNGNDTTMNASLVQSTPVHSHACDNKNDAEVSKHFADLTPVNKNSFDDEDFDDDDVIVPIRNFKSKRLLHEIDAKRESMEDQYEFILNEETIKLSTRVCGETNDNHNRNNNEINATLIKSENSNDHEFDQLLLETFCVNNPPENDNLIQSINNIKQKHNFMTNDKRNVSNEKLNLSTSSSDNDRLLKRGRLYDNLNMKLSQEILIDEPQNGNHHHDEDNNGNNDSRDRFKTIKLNRKPRNGMVDVDVDSQNSASSSTSSEIIQKTQDSKIAFKKPVPLKFSSKFGFSKPTESTTNNEFKYSHKANSIDNLDNTTAQRNLYSNKISGSSSNISSLGVKSKSINNLMFSKAYGYGGSRPELQTASNPKLRYLPSNPANDFSKTNQQTRTNMVNPSSGYFKNTQQQPLKKLEIMQRPRDENIPMNDFHNENSHNVPKTIKPTGAIPRASGLRPPTSIPRTSAISGLPRPNTKR